MFLLPSNILLPPASLIIVKNGGLVKEFSLKTHAKTVFIPYKIEARVRVLPDNTDILSLYTQGRPRCKAGVFQSCGRLYLVTGGVITDRKLRRTYR
jgi:hypothetical protein